MPLVVLAAAGGWLAEKTRQGARAEGRRTGPFAGLSPVALLGIVAAAVAILGLFALSAGVFEESPSKALESAFRAANEGDHEEANEYLAARILENAGGSSSGELQAFWDAATENGTVTEISARNEEVNGQRAEVEIGVSYREGGSSGTVVAMIREDEEWKIAPQGTPGLYEGS